MTKLENLIRQARQAPEKLTPKVRARLNAHLLSKGEPLLFPPTSEPAQQTPAPTMIPDGAELERLKASYKSEMAHFAANPDQFTNEQHSRMYRVRALISMSESAQKL